MNDEKKPGRTVATKAMIERLYDEAAGLYDHAGPSIFARFGARLVEHLSLKQGARTLDVATGSGAVLLPMAREVGPGGQATGVDQSEAILQEADRAVREAGLTNVRLSKMDAERLDFPDHAFDAVTCAFSLFMFPDIGAALREMHRVCMPGGCAGVSVFDKTPPPFDPGWPILLRQFMAYQTGVVMPQQVAYAPREMEALLTRTGFRSVATHAEMNDLVYPTLEDWWDFQFTVGTRLTIMGMEEETRASFKEEYMAKLRPLVAPDGLHLSLAVVYAIAER